MHNPRPLAAMQAGPISLTGADGVEFEAYAATPPDEAPRGGVVVIHHMPGFDEGSLEITRKFAAWGWAAVCPNLHHRDAPGADADDAAAASRAAGGVPDERLLGDVGAAAAHLRGLPGSNGKVGAIGFCSGGRQAVLAGIGLDLDAVVDCYGAFVLERPPAEMGMDVSSLEDRLPGLDCPVLGLFGNDDKYPSPPEVDRLDALLDEQGVDHEFHRFDGAGHAFFAADRPSYRPEAAVEGWRLVRDFFGRHLAGSN